MLGNGLLNNPLALQQGMQSLIANYPAAAYQAAPGQYGLADPSMMQAGLRHGSMGLAPEASPLDSR